MKKRGLIYTDFNEIDDEERLVLILPKTLNDLTENNITLKEGLKLVLYTDDSDTYGIPDEIIVEGIAEYDAPNERWTARIDWDEIKRVSHLSSEEIRRFIFL